MRKLLATGITNDEKASSRSQRYAGNVKYTLAINNLGSLPSDKRPSDAMTFVDDLLTMPATISCVLEATKATLNAMLKYGPMYKWPEHTPDNDAVVPEPPDGPRVAEDPPGSRVPIHRWYHSATWEDAKDHGPMVFARSTMVRCMRTLLKEKMQFGKGISRVLVVEVTMKDTSQPIVVCVFHLNNDTAKSVKERADFFECIGMLCVDKQVRFLVGDANMAMYTVVHHMDRQDIECHLLAKHLELNPNDDKEVLYDSCGIWVLGPVNVDRLRSCTYAQHMKAGTRAPQTPPRRHDAPSPGCRRGRVEADSRPPPHHPRCLPPGAHRRGQLR